MGCSKYHPLLQLHPSEGLQKIRFPPPLYSVLHEGRFECPGQSGTDLRRRVLPAVVCRFFEVCINPETAEPFPLVNSQDERDPPAADKYECFCSCGHLPSRHSKPFSERKLISSRKANCRTKELLQKCNKHALRSDG